MPSLWANSQGFRAWSPQPDYSLSSPSVCSFSDQLFPVWSLGWPESDPTAIEGSFTPLLPLFAQRSVDLVPPSSLSLAPLKVLCFLWPDPLQVPCSSLSSGRSETSTSFGLGLGDDSFLHHVSSVTPSFDLSLSWLLHSTLWSIFRTLWAVVYCVFQLSRPLDFLQKHLSASPAACVWAEQAVSFAFDWPGSSISESSAPRRASIRTGYRSQIWSYQSLTSGLPSAVQPAVQNWHDSSLLDLSKI